MLDSEKDNDLMKNTWVVHFQSISFFFHYVIEWLTPIPLESVLHLMKYQLKMYRYAEPKHWSSITRRMIWWRYFLSLWCPISPRIIAAAICTLPYCHYVWTYAQSYTMMTMRATSATERFLIGHFLFVSFLKSIWTAVHNSIIILGRYYTVWPFAFTAIWGVSETTREYKRWTDQLSSDTRKVKTIVASI